METTKINEYKVINAEHIIDPPHPDRHEVTPESVEDLVNSISLIGLKEPLIVRRVGEKYEVVAGHRRFKACLIANRVNIPCIIEDLSDEEADNVKAHENLYRKPLTPVEEALSLARVIGDDLNKIPEIARMRGQSQNWVKDRLDILHYPDYFIQPLNEGQIKLGVAKILAQIQDEGYRRMFFDNAIRDGMTIATAEYYYNQWKGGVLAPSEQIEVTAQDNPRFVVQKFRVKCAKCGIDAIEPNVTSVFIHESCPSIEEQPVS